LAAQDEAVKEVTPSTGLGIERRRKAPWRLLKLVDRYHATAEVLEVCGRGLCSLRLQRYWGDYVL
jgi:hypothetical protein